MDLLVGIDGNFSEWRDALRVDPNRPRLPLTYMLGAAFYQRGHRLFAVHSSNHKAEGVPAHPFKHVYPPARLLHVMAQVDLAFFWAAQGISATWMQAFLKFPQRKKVVLASYVWDLKTMPALKRYGLGLMTQMCAYFTRALSFITSEQCQSAERFLSGKVPVIKCPYGVDTRFYRLPSSFSDVPEAYRNDVDKLITEPYFFLPGDQQRCDQDVLDIVAHSGLRMVRAPQGHQAAEQLRKQAGERGLSDRLFIFEKINYPFLRFLFHRAAACAGLVDSSWQPAGWTVACESLASGLPVVLYDGLVSRELQNRGAGKFLHIVRRGDLQTFEETLRSTMSHQQGNKFSQEARQFAERELDLESCSEHFIRQIEGLVS